MHRPAQRAAFESPLHFFVNALRFMNGAVVPGTGAPDWGMLFPYLDRDAFQPMVERDFLLLMQSFELGGSNFVPTSRWSFEPQGAFL